MPAVEVCAAVVIRRGRILLATRRPGAHLAGAWEFPGGKIQPGETPGGCIIRELREELAMPVREATELFATTYDYPEKRVRLHFMLCVADGNAPEPVPCEGQRCGWFAPGQWAGMDFAPADAAMLREYGDQLRRLCVEKPPSAAASAGRSRLPSWLRVPFIGGEARRQMGHLLRRGALHTVCEGAKCPNRCECWRNRTATFMILGDVCTRACAFCAVRHGRPLPVSAEEPDRIAGCVAELGLKYAVVTCVTRDDLPDGGAAAMAQTILAIRRRCPDCRVEVLVSDYQGDRTAIDTVLAAKPAVFGHNLETVERLSGHVRCGASYRRSLAVLSHAARHGDGAVVKSGMMLGLGERDGEVRQALADLAGAGVRSITLGQYLQPGPGQLPVARFVPPEEFDAWARCAREEFGFQKAVCGPLVRSSYHAGEE